MSPIGRRKRNWNRLKATPELVKKVTESLSELALRPSRTDQS